jgi:peptide/nickel transport system substrate-binding protein
LNPDVGSSILGLWEGFLTTNDIEVVDDYTVKLNLAQPKLDVPENLFHYPAQIMHRSFNGDITTGKNPSTGPYVLEEYKTGERVKIKAREGYWQMGEDGKPLPYLDAIEFIDLGNDQTAAVTALQSGQVHSIYDVTPDSFLALRDDPNIVVSPITTAQSRVLRMRVDLEPWTDNNVRLALKKCQNREKILDQAYFGEGLLGHDTHVSPVQPEFAPMDVPEYDPEGAKKLLEEAGHGDGLDVSISVGTGWTDIVSYIETLQEDAKPAGINITLDTMPNSSYWDLWTETPVGVTPWTHRPLAVMLLPLAYIADAEGKPVPWNESRWVDEEFTQLLQKAQGTLDVEARRAIMADLQRIQAERGSIGIAWWQNIWRVYNPGFQNIEPHPTDYYLWREVWYDPDKDPNA